MTPRMDLQMTCIYNWKSSGYNHWNWVYNEDVLQGCVVFFCSNVVWATRNKFCVAHPGCCFSAKRWLWIQGILVSSENGKICTVKCWGRSAHPLFLPQKKKTGLMFEPGYAIGWKYSSDLNLLVNPPPFWWLNLHDWCLDTMFMIVYVCILYLHIHMGADRKCKSKNYERACVFHHPRL